MIRGVFLPSTGTLHAQLRTRIARDAIARGMGLYTDGVHTVLLPAPLPGWIRLAVVMRDHDDTDNQITDQEAA